MWSCVLKTKLGLCWLTVQLHIPIISMSATEWRERCEDEWAMPDSQLPFSLWNHLVLNFRSGLCSAGTRTRLKVLEVVDFVSPLYSFWMWAWTTISGRLVAFKVKVYMSAIQHRQQGQSQNKKTLCESIIYRHKKTFLSTGWGNYLVTFQSSLFQNILLFYMYESEGISKQNSHEVLWWM